MEKKMNKCWINPNNMWKIRWDFYIMVCLVLAATLTPWQLAFVEKDPLELLIMNLLIDFSFLADIIITFFSAYVDESTMQMVTNKRVIARKYLKFWFWMDIVSIIPFDQIVNLAGDENNELKQVAKFTRVGKLYKMIRMVRMVKMFRIVKDRKKILANLDSVLKTKPGIERLIFFSLSFFLFNHTFCCIWIMLASFQEDQNNWREAYREKFVDVNGSYLTDFFSDSEWYIVGFYFITTTVTTVGYGDIGPMNTTERIFCSALMLIGVIGFSYTTGALASIISNQDSANIKLQDKLHLLQKIRRQFKLSDKLFNDLKIAIKYEYSKNIDGLGEFIDRLPHRLKINMSKEIHRDLTQTFSFFERQPEKQFLSWVGHRLTPRIIQEEQYIYQETENIQEVFFCIQGKIAYVLPRYNNANYYWSVRGDIFGFEDAIYNCHQAQVEIDVNQLANQKSFGDRCFSTMSVTMCEALTLNVNELMKVANEFPRTFEFFFVEQQERLEQVLGARIAFRNHDNNCLKRTKTKMGSRNFQVNDRNRQMLFGDEIDLPAKNLPYYQNENDSDITESELNSLRSDMSRQSIAIEKTVDPDSILNTQRDCQKSKNNNLSQKAELRTQNTKRPSLLTPTVSFLPENQTEKTTIQAQNSWRTNAPNKNVISDTLPLPEDPDFSPGLPGSKFFGNRSQTQSFNSHQAAVTARIRRIVTSSDQRLADIEECLDSEHSSQSKFQTHDTKKTMDKQQRRLSFSSSSCSISSSSYQSNKNCEQRNRSSIPHKEESKTGFINITHTADDQLMLGLARLDQKLQQQEQTNKSDEKSKIRQVKELDNPSESDINLRFNNTQNQISTSSKQQDRLRIVDTDADRQDKNQVVANKSIIVQNQPHLLKLPLPEVTQKPEPQKLPHKPTQSPTSPEVLITLTSREKKAEFQALHGINNMDTTSKTSSTEYKNDMQVLNSLKQSVWFNQSNPQTNLPSSQKRGSILVVQKISPRRDSTNEKPSVRGASPILETIEEQKEDRLMQMVDMKFQKFEKIIQNFSSQMSELRNEVKIMKIKLKDAKVL